MRSISLRVLLSTCNLFNQTVGAQRSERLQARIFEPTTKLTTIERKAFMTDNQVMALVKQLERIADAVESIDGTLENIDGTLAKLAERMGNADEN